MTRARLAALWAALVVLAMGLSALIPPMQSPDEHSHVMRAYALAHGEFLLDTPPGQSTGAPIDEGLLLFVRPYLMKVVTERASRLTPADKEMAHGLKWRHKEHFFPIPGTGYYFPLAYLPHAAALGIGEALDWSIIHSYRLARAACIATIAALLIAAFRVLRPPLLAVALLALPMTVYQMLQPTLDGVTTALAVLALSLFTRRMMDEEGGSPREGWLLAACLFVVATTRVHLFPLMALPLFLAWRRRSWRAALPGLAATVAALAWTGYAITHTVDERVKRAQGTGELVRHYVLHPFDYLRVVWNSLTDDKLATEYSRSFIGVIGWLDTHMALYWYTALWIGLGVCLVLTLAIAAPQRNAAGRGVLAALGLASVGLAFFALLVTWTPHPATTVEGIQGRYFIVPALALAYALAPAPGPRRAARWPWAVAALFTGVALYALIATILGRYH